MIQPAVNGRVLQTHDMWRFVGRVDTFAEQMPNGTYKVHQRKLNYRDLMDHLAGRNTYGTYTLKEDGTVRCVTFDIDSLDAAELYRVVGLLNCPYLAVTSAGKGYHILVTWEKPIPAEVAHAFAQDIAQRAGYSGEAFPRQAKAEGGKGLGSLTRLPFGVNRKTGRRSEYLMGTLEYAAPFTPAQQHMLLREAEKPNGTFGTQQGSNSYPQGGPQAGWLAELFEDPKPANGRNTALNKYVWWLQGKGFPEDLVRLCAEYVNENVFADPLDDRELQTLLRRR